MYSNKKDKKTLVLLIKKKILEFPLARARHSGIKKLMPPSRPSLSSSSSSFLNLFFLVKTFYAEMKRKKVK